MKVTVLGCGRWGTFLGWYANKIGHQVCIWGRETSVNYQELENTRRNEYQEIGDDIKLTYSLEEAIEFGDYIIIAVSAQQLRTFLSRLNAYDLSNKTFIICMKGIENETGKRLTQVFYDVIEQKTNLAIWVGPGHVQAYLEGIPNCMVISSNDIEVTSKVIENFNSDLIRLYIGQDLIGNEIGAASKNVIGIAAGMLDGLKYGSLKGALMARGTREISRLVRAMGGNELTIYGLSHLGDYEATLFSPYSHNRRFGEDYVLGKHFGKLAEGVSTVESLIILSQKYHVELPICHAIYSILHDKNDPKDVLTSLFFRSIKFEF